MHWLTIFKHYIVGDVDQIVYGANAACAKAFAHPSGRGRNLDVLYHSCNIPAAKVGVFDFNGKQVIDIAAFVLDLRLREVELLVKGRGSFPCKADDGKAVRAVGGYLEFHGGIVDTESVADVIAGLAAFLNDENAVLDGVGEIVNGYAQLRNGAHHSLGNDSAELAFFNFHAICKGGVIEGDRNKGAFKNIGGGRYYLNGAVAHIHLTNLKLVSVRMFFNINNSAYNAVGYIVRFFGIAFHFGTGHCHGVAKLLWRNAGINIVAEPS